MPALFIRMIGCYTSLTLQQFRSFGQTLLCAIAFLLCSSSRIVAHPISMSTAVADIYQDRVQVELRILTEDLMFYHSIEADGDQLLSRKNLLEAAEAHRAFLKKYFLNPRRRARMFHYPLTLSGIHINKGFLKILQVM